ncbi:hypothetical protein V5799_029827 [Amblyomma americanum]|uniref:Uncharacterized protein n=1 Tax=Amblyomma americanum TaxID=6943 RepID=A0AAQ4EPZ1_AMBAM
MLSQGFSDDVRIFPFRPLKKLVVVSTSGIFSLLTHPEMDSHRTGHKRTNSTMITGQQQHALQDELL